MMNRRMPSGTLGFQLGMNPIISGNTVAVKATAGTWSWGGFQPAGSGQWRPLPQSRWTKKGAVKPYTKSADRSLAGQS